MSISPIFKGKRRNVDAKNSPAATGMTISRVFDAPRSLVFKAFTDPSMMSRWWGPRQFTAPLVESDARKGGKQRIHMRGPEGTIYPMHGVYEEFDEPQRLVLRTFVEGDKGDIVLEVLNTLTFAEQAGKTKLVLQVTIVKVAAEGAYMLEGMNEGWNQQLDKLAELLSI
jgi:uncharacterized protein YndB with AHSA1/START domain